MLNKFKLILGSHSGVNIAERVNSILLDYGLETKVNYVVTDNASSMKKAFSLTFPNPTAAATATTDEETDHTAANVDDPTLWEETEDIELEIAEVTRTKERISCFAHTLQLAIGDGLSVSNNLALSNYTAHFCMLVFVVY